MAHQTTYAVLDDRFRALWQRCLSSEVRMNPAPVYDDLVKRYNEPVRHYHGWTHIIRCLDEFDRVSARIDRPDALELALWFHDAVYVPSAPDNEQCSADLFKKWGTTNFPPGFVEKVCALILITKHKLPPHEGDESYVVDIDLSSFGADWPDFVRDSKNVRKEQAHVPDSLYYPAHGRFLKMLLDRPRIFHTQFFHECYEEVARQNIDRLLASSHYSGIHF